MCAFLSCKVSCCALVDVSTPVSMHHWPAKGGKSIIIKFSLLYKCRSVASKTLNIYLLYRIPNCGTFAIFNYFSTLIRKLTVIPMKIMLVQ